MLKRYFIVLFAFHGLNQKIYSSVFARKEDSLFSSTPVNNKPSPKTMIIQNKHDSLPNLDALNFSSTSTRPISSGNGLTPSFNERSLSSLNFTPSV
ncbi:MAG: hypothetical protein NTU89_00855 [Candidatus Dependentiae bacterium]|nr:hypothetical protein [Candidatus Dependentiae bacterium]